MKKYALAIVAALFASGTGQAATVLNGSFESGIEVNQYNTLYTGSNDITGWTVTGGSIDYIGNYWQAAQGSKSVDLAGLSIGTISQTIATIVGQAYRLSFFISANPDGGSSTRLGTVSAAGSAAQQLSFNAPSSHASMNWLEQSYNFTATDTQTQISFAAQTPSADSNGLSAFGLALDDVSIAAIPEPGTWALLFAGFVAIGSVMRRRRNVTVSFS